VLTLTSTTSTTATLSWTAVPGATTYTLERATLPAGPFTPVLAGIEGTTFTATGLAPVAPNHFRVIAVGPFQQQSPPSNVVVAFTTP
jgi:hypothetical protein